jgi:hypothetical protein
MTPAKLGKPGHGVGEVFVKVTKKKPLPGFGFFGRGEIGAWPSQGRLPEKKPQKLQSGDQKLAARDNL